MSRSLFAHRGYDGIKLKEFRVGREPLKCLEPALLLADPPFDPLRSRFLCSELQLEGGSVLRQLVTKTNKQVRCAALIPLKIPTRQLPEVSWSKIWQHVAFGCLLRAQDRPSRYILRAPRSDLVASRVTTVEQPFNAHSPRTSELIEKVGAWHLAHFPVALCCARNAKPLGKLVPFEPQPPANQGNAGSHIRVNELSGQGLEVVVPAGETLTRGSRLDKFN